MDYACVLGRLWNSRSDVVVEGMEWVAGGGRGKR